MKKIKKLSLFSLLGTIGIAITPILAKTHVETSYNVISTNRDDSVTKGISGSEETLTFTFLNTDNITWKGKKFASEATNDDIKSILVPSKAYGANYYVKLLPVTTQMENQGYVNFVIKQVVTNFTDGVNNGVSTTTVFVKPTNGSASSDYSENQTIDNETVEKDAIWTTKSISGLFLQKKYNFKWNSDEEIGKFLKSTEKTTLTSEDILSNFVSQADSTDILPSDTNGTFSQNEITSTSLNVNEKESSDVDKISSDDAKKYGIGLVTINFEKSANKSLSASDWVSGSIPTNTKRIVRGLVGGDGSKHTMDLNVTSSISTFKNTVLDLKKIKESNPNFVYPMAASDDTAKISDFTPTELVNATNLTSLLTTTDYIKNDSSNTTTLPAIYLTYMDKNQFTNLNLPFQGTGLSFQTNVAYVDANNNPILNDDGTQKTTGSKSVNTVVGIRNVQANANDIDGTLELKITYDYYDVYNNVIVTGYVVPITITGLKTNPDADKNLYFQWKSDNDLLESSSADFLNAYQQNINNEAYLQDLSNTLFFGSDDTYKKARKFVAEKVDNNSKQVKVTITFDSFGGEWYTNESGQKVSGKKFTHTFTFSSDTSNSNVKFNSQSSVESSISNWKYLTPEKLINNISNGTIDKNIFFTSSLSTRSTTNILFVPNYTNDGIIVTVNDGNNYTSTSFTGLKQGQSDSYIYNFSFSVNSNDEDYQKLLKIPLEEITKKDVLDLYLSKLEIFKSGFDLITEDNITISPNVANGSLTITLNLPQFDPNNENATRTFTTTIQGLTSQVIVDNNSYIAPLNLTIPLSAVFAGLITIGLSVALIIIIRKRVKLSKAKKYK